MPDKDDDKKKKEEEKPVVEVIVIKNESDLEKAIQTIWGDS